MKDLVALVAEGSKIGISFFAEPPVMDVVNLLRAIAAHFTLSAGGTHFVFSGFTPMIG